jgi:general secretion pathway protein F
MPTAHAARLKLRRNGIFPIELREEADAQSDKREFDVLRFLRRVKLQEVAITVRQLSTLLSAGLPLVVSLTAIIEQVPNPALKKSSPRCANGSTKGVPWPTPLRNIRASFPRCL